MSTRGTLTVAAGLLLCFTCWLVGGCNSQEKDGLTKNGVDEKQTEKVAPKPKPLLEGWKKPALAIVFSGEQHGYLEPCGCSETQSGGLARRADLFRQIKKRGWPVTAFDLGGTVNRNRRARRQSKLKFVTVIHSLKDMAYRGLALGLEELKLDDPEPGYLLSEPVTAAHSDNPDEALAFLSANVIVFDSPDLLRVPWQTVDVNGVKLGVTAVLGNSIKGDLSPEGANTSISVKPPEEVLPTVIKSIEETNPDLMILLSHSELDESRELARKFPQFDVILTAGGPEDPDDEPEMIGKTMLIQVGHKGKYVGVVGYYPQDETNRLRFELVDLDKDRFRNSKVMRGHMRFYQEQLREERLAEIETIGPHPSGNRFVGAAKCGECHKKTFDKWKTTRHAQAYNSLENGRKGEETTWISRIYDSECLACHVTGWHPREALRYESGFVSADSTAHLDGQQCENCHGPGSRHVELEELWKNDRKQVEKDELVASRTSMHLSVKEMQQEGANAKQNVCYRCHDLDNSPKFNLEKYWEEVKHPWRD